MNQNQAMLKKAIDTAALASGGLLNPEQADKFIDLTVDQTVMLKMVRVHRTDNPRGELDKLNLGSPVTEKATENADTGNVYGATFDKVEYTVVKTRSAFNLTTEAQQQNIEKTELKNTIMTAFGKRMGTDLELLAIQGDSSITGATAMNRLLKSYDGWGIQTDTGTHLINAAGTNVSKALFSDMIKALPSKYLMMVNDLRFFVSPIIWQNYIDQLSDRATALGDRVLTTKEQPLAFGIPLVRVPLVPDDMDYTIGTDSYSNGSFIWLTVSENFIFVPLRRFDVFWEFKPRYDRWENTTYSQTDVQIENKDMIVKAYNIGTDSTTLYT